MQLNGFRWPAGFQSAAVFTFDVDGSAEQQLYEGNVLGANSAGDYGPKVGLPRILNLLERQDLSATFFVAAWIAERFPERIVEISKRGHEAIWFARYDQIAQHFLENDSTLRQSVQSV
jgi:peptidoglycan/xylan/chitin deacetylase (PgdA/CDA1 family)